jgi:predicted RNA-binding protein (virulence factor B family)
VQALAEKILLILDKNGGYISVNDKTRPEIIYKIFGMSKKSFKMAIGALYREKQIVIEESGIRKVIK